MVFSEAGSLVVRGAASCCGKGDSGEGEWDYRCSNPIRS